MYETVVLDFNSIIKLMFYNDALSRGWLFLTKFDQKLYKHLFSDIIIKHHSLVVEFYFIWYFKISSSK